MINTSTSRSRVVTGGGAPAMLRVNPDWASLPLFDRKGWTRLPFGAFTESVNERVEPADAAEEIYVGLDDLDSGSLHIRRWGKGSDVIGTKLRFRKGDVIFGRRRAYQRKLAVAEGDGICSAHAMVVRAKPAVVLPEFLPFLMMSDKFMNRAVEISVGSLSPTINWTTLRLEEFELPPLDQQRRIAEILWAVDEAKKGYGELLASTAAQRQAVVTEFANRNGSTKVLLGDHLAKVQYGTSRRASPEEKPGLLPVLRIPNVISGRVDYDDIAWLDHSEDVDRYGLADDDVLIVRTDGNPDYVGRSAVYRRQRFDKCLFASYLIRLVCDRDTLSAGFLHEMLQSPNMRREIRKQVKSSAGNYNLNTQGIRGLRIPVPSLAEQEALLGRLACVDSASAGVDHSMARLIEVNSASLDAIFTDRRA